MHHFRKSSKSSTGDSKRKSGSSSKKDKDKDKDAKDDKPSILPKPKHHRTNTAPDPPSLLRLPSTTSTVSASSRSRRATNPTTPQSASTATSPSYFSPQTTAPPATTALTNNEVRSPGARRPPASFSGHGIDTSRGPPITLITRGNSDIARKTTQKPADYAYAQQQFLQSGLVSPSGSQSSSSIHRRGESDQSSQRAPHSRSSSSNHNTQQTNTTAPATRRSSTSTARPSHLPKPPPPPTQQSQPPPPQQQQQQQMASSVDDDSSEYDSDSPSQTEDPPRPQQQHHNHRHQQQQQHRSASRAKPSDDTDHSEDLFLNIAADTAPSQRPADAASRHDRLRSRIGRINRQSSPLPLQPPSPGPSSSVTPTSTRVTPAADSRSTTHARRVSHQPSSSRTLAERGPLTPLTPIERPPSRVPELSSKASFSRAVDAQLSPQDFLAQFNYRRRPSQPDALQTPPARTGTYRPSNLGHYSTPRDDPRTQQETAQPAASSLADGTESHGSTGPAVSVWDELDELKTRIRRIEMGGKIPATSGQIVSQATSERPRTANTSATTVSSSPKQQRKSGPSPSESTVGAPASNRIHPLLREALAKARQHTTPAVYRTLEATATEALTLAEMTGTAGPQGTLHSASSILGGASAADRQVRRKADNICRSLTELCIAMCDTKPALASPAMRSTTINRRPSVQLSNDSPTIRPSIEPESNTLNNISPSRALSRIEARRTSMLSGTPRDASQEPYDLDRQIPSRISRAGTSLHRNRHSVDDDEDEPPIRAPSRAMTDFRSLRSTAEKSRATTGRQYTSREPMPDLQPAPSLQSSASLRRPTVSGVGNENSLLFRDGSRRYDFHRESSPAYEKQAAGTLRARAQLAANRNPNNRNSIGGMQDLGRSVSLGRRIRGNSTGE